MPDDPNIQGDPKNYVTFGYLEPLLARRIMERLSRQQVRFIARDASRFDVSTAGTVDSVSQRIPFPIVARNNRLELFIHSDDQNLARKIIDNT